MYQAMYSAVVLTILIRFVYLVVIRKAQFGVVSALIGTLYTVALFIPAQLQSAGLMKSKLTSASILNLPYGSEVTSLSAAWSIELIIVLALEIAVTWGARLSRRREAADILLRKSVTRARGAIVILLIVGVIASVLFPAGAIEDRGQETGQGILVLLRTCLVVGLAGLAFYNFFRKTLFVIVAILGIVFLVASSVRSPLLVIMLGYVAGVLARKELKVRNMVGFVIMGLGLGITGGFMSSYRGEVIQGHAPDAMAVISKTMENPFVTAYQGGIDTLDGYRLSKQVQPGEPPNPSNLLVAFTTFVPRAMWPDKPTDLSIGITARYLHWGSGGVFLSPIGYLRIALGGYYEALSAWAVLIFILILLYIYQYRTIAGMFILILVFRMTLAGSPFDVYYTLTLVLIFLGARLLISAYHQIASTAARRPIQNVSVTLALDPSEDRI